MSSNEHLLIFDTNTLYISNKDRADFTSFNFNQSFYRVIDKIEALDVFEYIKIGIPKVVWRELTNQKIEAYNKKISEIKLQHEKFLFPFHKLKEEETDIKYEDYLKEKLSEFKHSINNRMVKIIDIDIPSNSRFESIIRRALDKKPPFEGVDKQSDKGFKDALLWESILEFRKNNPSIEIILYTNDKLFCDELKDEYNSLFTGSNIKIFSKAQETELMNDLEKIALSIDSSTYITKIDDKNIGFLDWLESEEFEEQFKKLQFKFEEVNKYTKLDKININMIYNIDEYDDESEILNDIIVNLNVTLDFLVLENNKTQEKYDLTVYINSIDNSSFNIDDIEIIEEEDDYDQLESCYPGEYSKIF